MISVTARAAVSVLIAAGLWAAPATGTAAPASEAPAVVPLSSVWLTSPDRSRLLAHPNPSTALPAVTLTADGTRRYQTWMGAGAALTDASTQLLGPLGAGVRDQLFDPDAETGARLNLVRLPLSATDFSTRGWTWQDDPAVSPRPSSEAKAAVGYLAGVEQVRPDLQVVTAGWSAPAWMKTSGTLNGGALDAAHVADYSRLLVTQVRRLRALGVPVVATSLGNEPFHSWPTYPTMTMTDPQMTQLAGLAGPSLAADGVELWGLDHNWDHRDHVNAQLASANGRRFSRVAFHCYGDAKSERATGLQRPWAMTECGGGAWDPNWASTFQWQATNLVTDPVRRGSTALFLWNLALDPAHGPHTGGCSNCRGVVLVDPVTGTWSPNPEYYLLAHVARAADPGARRIGLTTVGDLPAVAFANPDGTVGYFGVNTGATRVVRLAAGTEQVRFSVAHGDLWSARLSGASLAPEADLAGDLVQWDGDTGSPRTTWLVTPDRRRLWVPDGATYSCLLADGAAAPRAIAADLLDQLYDQHGMWAACGSTLATYDALRRGMSLRTGDRSVRALLDGSGALVLQVAGAPTWTNPAGADVVTLDQTGNLVAATDLGSRVWQSGTSGKGVDRLVVTPGGKLRLMAGTKVVWSRG